MYLVDTHVLLWMLLTPQMLAPAVRNILEDNTKTTLISHVSLWDIGIKQARGKLDFGDYCLETLALDLTARGFALLPIHLPHILASTRLSPEHADPLDRLLVAQAKYENYTLITADDKLSNYGIKLLAA